MGPTKTDILVCSDKSFIFICKIVIHSRKYSMFSYVQNEIKRIEIKTNDIIKVQSLCIIQQIMMIIITQWLPPQIVGCKTVEILTSSPSANLIST